MRQDTSQDNLRFQDELCETVAAMKSRKPIPEEKPGSLLEALRAFLPSKHLFRSKPFLVFLVLSLLLVYFAPQLASLLRHYLSAH